MIMNPEKKIIEFNYLEPYDALEKYISDNKITNIDLYSDITIPNKFSEHFDHMLPFRIDGINIKVYGLLREIKNINLKKSEINSSYIASYGRLMEMMYEDMNHKLIHMNEYEILRRKINIVTFCKSVILFLDSTIKIIDMHSKQTIFCFGKCANGEHKCIKNHGLSPAEIKHMNNIRNIANLSHNYPATDTDYDNLHLYVDEKTDGSREIYDNGDKHFIKYFGNIYELYLHTCNILNKIICSLFTNVHEMNGNISLLCRNSIGFMPLDVTNHNGTIIGNCTPILQQ